MKELKQQNKNRRQINKDIQKKEIKKKCWLDDMKELKVKKGQLKWKYLFFSTRKKRFDLIDLACDVLQWNVSMERDKGRDWQKREKLMN